MTHATQFLLAMLWTGTHPSEWGGWFRPMAGRLACQPSKRSDGAITATSVLMGEARPTDVICPECRRLVWLATGERELGDRLEAA